MYIFEHSLSKKIGVERFNQVSKPTIADINNIVDVVYCVQIVEQILCQCPRSGLYMPYREYGAKDVRHSPRMCGRSTEDATSGRSSEVFFF